MQQRPLVKIVDHCQRLTRRQYDEDQGRPVADEEFEAAFDEACLSIWGLTNADVDWELVPEQAEIDPLKLDKVLREYALSRGYSLDGLIGGKLVPQAEAFVDMMKAEESNAFAKTPEQRAKLLLQHEASEFLDKKEGGVIKGF